MKKNIQVELYCNETLLSQNTSLPEKINVVGNNDDISEVNVVSQVNFSITYIIWLVGCPPVIKYTKQLCTHTFY